MEQYKVNFKREIDITGTTYIIAAKKELGFLCDYALFIPDNCNTDTTLLVHAINTGWNVPWHLEEALDIAKRSTYEKYNDSFLFASSLNIPSLTPIFPRIRGYYTQALGSDVFKNNLTNLLNDNSRKINNESLTEEEINELKTICVNLPDQLANMIKHSKSILQRLGINIDDKVIIEGYSAGSKFANLFSAIHPELVKICIAGGHGGLAIIPLKELQGTTLNFPLGINDLPNFDLEAFKQIISYFYIGDIDENDPAAIEVLNYEKDEDGNYIIKNESRAPIKDNNGHIIAKLDDDELYLPYYKDCYTKEEVNIIHNLFGKTIRERNKLKELLYQELGCNATFREYPGDHQTILKYNDDGKCIVKENIIEFIKETLEKEKRNTR